MDLRTYTDLLAASFTQNHIFNSNVQLFGTLVLSLNDQYSNNNIQPTLYLAQTWSPDPT